MNPVRFARVVACLTVVCAVACVEAPEAALRASLRFSPTPPSVGPARLILELTDSLGRPVTDASIRIEGRPIDGPTRSVASTPAREEGAGRYVVDTYDFDVAGRWVLEVRARTAAGSELAREFETSVYGGPPGTP